MKPRPEWFPFVRGRILDRSGEMLVQDSATWQLRVDYKIVAFGKYGKRLERYWSRPGRAKEYLGIVQGPQEGRSEFHTRVREGLRQKTAEMWRDIMVFAEDYDLDKPSRIVERADRVVERVERIRDRRIVNRGYGEPENKPKTLREIVVREENIAHPIVKGLGQFVQVLAKERFADCPWIRIEPSSVRTYAPQIKPFAHILGRLGRLDTVYKKSDPSTEAALSEYRTNEFQGVSGVEYVAEKRLRGSRGLLLADQSKETERKYTEAKRGDRKSVV